MGNRAIITTENGWKNKKNNLGVYLHWNGGRDSVEGFLTYCKLKGYTSPEVGECRNWVGLIQVIANFFGDGGSLEVNTVNRLPSSVGDNGVYIIKDWEIIDRKEFDGREQREYELLDFLELIDSKMPEEEKLGIEFIHSKEIPTSDLKIGDTVFIPKYSTGYDKCEVIGFIEDKASDGTVIKEIPYVNLYCSECCDYKENGNNYITSKTKRVCQELDEIEEKEVSLDDALNLIIEHFKIDTVSLGFKSDTKLVNKVGCIFKYLVESREKDTNDENSNVNKAIYYLRNEFYSLLMQR